MTEGELKKRLIKPYIDDDEHVCPTLIDIVVDEAKKELAPEICESCWLYGGCNAKISKPNGCLLAMFEKWFGDST